VDETEAGWNLPETYQGTYLLTFADPSFDGLQVRMARHTFEVIEAATDLLDIDLDAARVGKLDLADFAKVSRALEAFAQSLVDWNLRIAGEPVSTDLATVKRLDLVFVMQVFVVWLSIIVDVSGGSGLADVPAEAA
jgi:hypothetical protein